MITVLFKADFIRKSMPMFRSLACLLIGKGNCDLLAVMKNGLKNYKMKRDEVNEGNLK